MEDGRTQTGKKEHRATFFCCFCQSGEVTGRNTWGPREHGRFKGQGRNLFLMGWVLPPEVMNSFEERHFKTIKVARTAFCFILFIIQFHPFSAGYLYIV